MTATPNYGGELPTIDADEDAWGSKNNTLHLLWDEKIKAVSILRDYIAGLFMVTAGGSSTLTVSGGVAASSANVAMMTLASNTAKTTSAWAVGSAVGGLDTGAIANNTWYTWYLIQRPDTGVVDVIYSVNTTSPTLPANYTLYRRIGAAKTNGSGQWTAFTQNGNQFLWVVPVTDYNTALTTTTPQLATLSVPPGVNVDAIVLAHADGGGGGYNYLTVSPPDIGGSSASTTTAQATYGTGQNPAQAEVTIRSNTSKQVYVAVSTAASTTVTLTTKGWIDTRGGS